MLTLGAALATSVTLAALTGANQAEAPGDPVASLLNCRSIEAADARLACQDAALGALAQALDTGRIEVTDHGAGPSPSALDRFTGVFARPAREPDAPSLAREEQLEDGAVAVIDDDGEIDSLRGLPVARVTTDSFDRLTVYLENGEIWRQTEMEFISVPRGDDLDGLTATIERGLFGSRFMELSHNNRRFRARRVN